ncbi:MAG: hypothetical protein DCC57_00940, partial [Chloroflexi bacterium]
HAAARPLLEILRGSQDEAIRMELALALARLVGDERHFVQLARSVRDQPGTASAQALAAARRQLAKMQGRNLGADVDLLAIEDALAREQLDAGAQALGLWLSEAEWARYGAVGCEVLLQEAAWRMQRGGARRREYLLLALHTLAVGRED